MAFKAERSTEWREWKYTAMNLKQNKNYDTKHLELKNLMEMRVEG